MNLQELRIIDFLEGSKDPVTVFLNCGKGLSELGTWDIGEPKDTENDREGKRARYAERKGGDQKAWN